MRRGGSLTKRKNERYGCAYVVVCPLRLCLGRRSSPSKLIECVMIFFCHPSLSGLYVKDRYVFLPYGGGCCQTITATPASATSLRHIPSRCVCLVCSCYGVRAGHQPSPPSGRISASAPLLLFYGLTPSSLCRSSA